MSRRNPNPNRVIVDSKSKKIKKKINTARDFADVPQKLSPSRSKRLPNEEQLFQDSVAETIPSLSFVTESSFPENFISKLKEDWLNSCTADLNKSNPGFDNFDSSKKETLILDRFLLSDMKFSCGGMLPEDTHTLPQLPSPLVLQVDKMVNLSGDTQDRRLLLTMTDGDQFIHGVESKPIEDLKVSFPAGFKVRVDEASFYRGLLRLVPEGLKVLGGKVEGLESASTKSVEKVIESPKVDRMQTVDGPPLASKDTTAAPKPRDYDEIIKANTGRLTAVYGALDYTYLTKVLADWEQRKKLNDGETIRWKIQGTMKGLCRFNYYGRTDYELVVRFCDGSCTSKILIHSKEVQRQIGLTPEETSNYFSSVPKDDMWEAVTDIEAKLSTLQCTLGIEMKSNSEFLVAVEVDSAFDMLWSQKYNVK